MDFAIKLFHGGLLSLPIALVLLVGSEAEGGNGIADSPTILHSNSVSLSPTPRVAAFYYNRYGTHAIDRQWRFWRAANPFAEYSPPQDIACDYYPLLGPYSVNDTNVIDQHLAWLERARIGVIIVEWCGRDSFEARALPLIFERAAKTPVKIAFIIEPYVGRSAESLVDDVKFIYDNYGKSPAFFRTNDKSRHSPQNKAKGLFFIWAANYKYVEGFYPKVIGPEANAQYWWPAIDAIHALPDGGIVLLHPPFPEWIDAGHFDGVYNYANPRLSDELAIWARALPPGAWYVPSVIPGNEGTRIGYDPSVNDPRQDGKLYDYQWTKALGTGVEPHMVTVTSFNEWNEGTQIEPAATTASSGKGYNYKTYGSLGSLGYLERTAKWVDKFQNLSWPSFKGKRMVDVTLGKTNVENGLWQVDLALPDDGGTSPVIVNGCECRGFVEHPSGAGYMYFAVHNDFFYGGNSPITVTVEYYAGGVGDFWIDYDSGDQSLPLKGAYKPTGVVRSDGSRLWRKATFVLSNAYFADRQKSGMDFRIGRRNDPNFNLCIRRVVVNR